MHVNINLRKRKFNEEYFTPFDRVYECRLTEVIMPFKSVDVVMLLSQYDDIIAAVMDTLNTHSGNLQKKVNARKHRAV
jgi:hypothetical protein